MSDFVAICMTHCGTGGFWNAGEMELPILRIVSFFSRDLSRLEQVSSWVLAP